MFASEQLDAILVLTTLSTHHEIGIAGVEAGLHVLVEKPLAVSVRCGRALVEAARRRGVRLGVAEVVRYQPYVRMAKWAVDQVLLGEVQMTGFFQAGGYWAPDRIVAGTSWRHRKLLAGGGVSVDWLVHYFHQLRYIVGEIQEVSARALGATSSRVTRDETGRVVEQVVNEVDDTVSATLRFAGGAMGSLFVSWTGRGTPVSVAPVYYGTRGSLQGDRIVFEDGKVQSLAEVFLREADAAAREQVAPSGVEDAFALQLLDFLRAVRTGDEMESSGDEGIRDLAVSFALLESSSLNRPVRVGDVLSGHIAHYEQEINQHYGL
jgi:predicted dehydrogenase